MPPHATVPRVTIGPMRRFAEEIRVRLDRFGRLPALPLFLLSVGVPAALVLLGARDAGVWAGLALFVLFLCYAWARPCQRWDVACTVLVPGATGGLAEEVAGIDARYVAVPLILVAIVFLAVTDRDDRRRRQTPPIVERHSC